MRTEKNYNCLLEKFVCNIEIAQIKERNLPDIEYRKRVKNETGKLVLARGDKMTLQAKVRCGLVRICYQNGMNVAEALRIYCRNH